MNDPHVKAIHYFIEHDDSVDYRNVAALVYEDELFRVKADKVEVVFEPKNHYATEEDARSLAGKPLAGFCATPDRRIIVLCGMIVSVIRFKNPLLHRQSSLRKRRLGENRGFRPSF